MPIVSHDRSISACCPNMYCVKYVYYVLIVCLFFWQVNMVIGILVFNKLVSKDGITDMKLKERAGYALYHTFTLSPLTSLVV